ncbi:MAG TPA: hypothetical protein VFE47_01170 [Tepidisphaeraceae bacterium]|jgi:hypothetical protein|nr:hypothetical protein [Tepidisphaeraceae bacterium]
MGTFNIANSKGRDAIVGAQSVKKPIKVRWLDEQGRQVQSSRLIKSDLGHDLGALETKAGGREKVAQSLIDGDPEIDIERFGSVLKECSRVFVDPDGKIVHKVRQYEIVRNPDGSERERRPRKITQPNCSTETPLKWSGKLFKKKEIYNKFVFAGKRQICHVNGLTYDFLFAMAKELEETESLMLLGSGPKANQPLVLTRNGQQFRGFLEGRTEGEKYCLILHLSNMELKVAPPPPPTAA